MINKTANMETAGKHELTTDQSAASTHQEVVESGRTTTRNNKIRIHKIK